MSGGLGTAVEVALRKVSSKGHDGSATAIDSEFDTLPFLYLRGSLSIEELLERGGFHTEEDIRQLQIKFLGDISGIDNYRRQVEGIIELQISLEKPADRLEEIYQELQRSEAEYKQKAEDEYVRIAKRLLPKVVREEKGVVGEMFFRLLIQDTPRNVMQLAKPYHPRIIFSRDWINSMRCLNGEYSLSPYSNKIREIITL